MSMRQTLDHPWFTGVQIDNSLQFTGVQIDNHSSDLMESKCEVRGSVGAVKCEAIHAAAVSKHVRKEAIQAAAVSKHVQGSRAALLIFYTLEGLDTMRVTIYTIEGSRI